MYYHTCPYCGANLDRTSTVTAFPVSVEIPKWNSMDGVRARNHKRSGRART